MESVQNFEQKSLGRLDRGAAWNSLCSGMFLTGHVSSNTAIMQSHIFDKEFYAVPLSKLPNDFWT